MSDVRERPASGARTVRATKGGQPPGRPVCAMQDAPPRSRAKIWRPRPERAGRAHGSIGGGGLPAKFAGRSGRTYLSPFTARRLLVLFFPAADALDRGAGAAAAGGSAGISVLSGTTSGTTAGISVIEGTMQLGDAMMESIVVRCLFVVDGNQSHTRPLALVVGWVQTMVQTQLWRLGGGQMVWPGSTSGSALPRATFATSLASKNGPLARTELISAPRSDPKL